MEQREGAESTIAATSRKRDAKRLVKRIDKLAGEIMDLECTLETKASKLREAHRRLGEINGQPELSCASKHSSGFVWSSAMIKWATRVRRHQQPLRVRRKLCHEEDAMGSSGTSRWLIT